MNLNFIKMNRRKVIKSLGISAAVIGTGLISACTNTENKEAKKLKALQDSLREANKPSERDKKIVNRQEMSFADPENPTKAELKHTPEIKIGETGDKSYTEIKITVGTGIIHPSTEDHWIDFIKLFADNNLVGNVEFEPGKAMGYASFKIKTEGITKLKAVIGCNIHGIWHSELTLT